MEQQASPAGATTSCEAAVNPSTGHPLGDAVLPAALQLVSAVHRGDPQAIRTALNGAQSAAESHPQWPTAVMVVLAGLVPEGRRPRDLLAWNDASGPNDWRASDA